VRLAELAEATGVPVPTIKYYLREGLLPAGLAQTRTRSAYGPAHVQRLRLVRSLREVGHLPVAEVAAVLAAVDDPEVPLLELLGTTQIAVAGRAEPAAAGHPLADDLLAELDWQVHPDSPLRPALERVLRALVQQGWPVDAQALQPWTDGAQAIAAAEVDVVLGQAAQGRDAAATVVALGTVLYGQLIAQLRLLAQESVSVSRLSSPIEHPGPR